MEPFSCAKVSSLMLLLVGGLPGGSFLFLLLFPFPIPVTLVPLDWTSVELGVSVLDEVLAVLVVASVDSWNRVKFTIDLPGMGCLEM